MKVHVRLFSTLARYSPSPGGEFVVDMEGSASVGELLEFLKLPSAVQRVVLVNGRHAKSFKVLSEGDRVTMFPPMTGG
ncbi:MAG: MoaD/ThiS family protein [Desulforhopalus sp.]